MKHKDDHKNNENPPRRALLNLEGGNRQGLERALAHLLGRKAPRPATPSPTEAVLAILTELGFKVVPAANSATPQLSHPFSGNRVVPLQLSDSDQSPEELAFGFAARYFPEMEFYLPYVSARAHYLAARRKPQNGPRPLGPEPEYDEDGFIQE